MGSREKRNSYTLPRPLLSLRKLNLNFFTGDEACEVREPLSVALSLKLIVWDACISVARSLSEDCYIHLCFGLFV